MVITDINGKVRLANDIEMPYLGLGVYVVREGIETVNAVECALEAGYRMIDTASFYGNENSVGNAITNYGIDRKEIFITSKVWNSDQGYQKTLDAFRLSLDKLKADYLDLYLIHWPVKGKFVETWRAFEKLYTEGYVKAIGVSNFTISHLEELFTYADIVPMVNQVEFHPYLSQPQLYSFCKRHGIQYEAWAPLMRGRAIEIEEIISLSKKYEKTPAQIILRWDLQKGIVTIPKSVKKERIIENADIFDFQLSLEDMQLMDSLNREERIGPDPDNVNF